MFRKAQYGEQGNIAQCAILQERLSKIINIRKKI
jgi:hypothetical protein